MDYTVMKVGERGVGGIMPVPDSSLKPAWVGYIFADDVDAKVESIKAAGGRVHRPGTDIEGVGRFAVVADPHGAMFNLLAPNGEDQPPLPMSTPGAIGWNELYAGDLQPAFEFYSAQFGWNEVRRVDMGAMGPYLVFGQGSGDGIGGMMTKPPHVPAPCWIYYFTVGDIDDAAGRVTSNGGTIMMGPTEVPGGSWVLMATDPQGAAFALVGKKG
jgi:uncharacterized protein